MIITLYVWKCDLCFIIVIPCFIIFTIIVKLLISTPQDIETYNTRLFKEEKDGHVTYILRIASVAKTGEFKCRMLTKTWNKEICLVLQPCIALDLVCLLLVKSTSWSFTIDTKVPRSSKGPVGFVISSFSLSLSLPLSPSPEDIKILFGCETWLCLTKYIPVVEYSAKNSWCSIYVFAHYEIFCVILLFKAEPYPGTDGEEDKVVTVLGSHEFKGCTFRVERGDYSGLLKRVVENLEKAKVKWKNFFWNNSHLINSAMNVFLFMLWCLLFLLYLKCHVVWTDNWYNGTS